MDKYRMEVGGLKERDRGGENIKKYSKAKIYLKVAAIYSIPFIIITLLLLYITDSSLNDSMFWFFLVPLVEGTIILFTLYIPIRIIKIISGVNRETGNIKGLKWGKIILYAALAGESSPPIPDTIPSPYKGGKFTMGNAAFYNNMRIWEQESKGRT